MIVYTATTLWTGPGRLDVTRSAVDRGVVAGEPFAPSRSIVSRMQRGVITWERYTALYRAEMRASYRANRAAWDELLSRSEVTLVCFCVGLHCHRYLLADILVRLGAESGGER